MSNLKGLKKSIFFSRGTDDSNNLRFETLYIATYEYVNISNFAVLDKKFWLEENGDLHTDHPQ